MAKVELKQPIIDEIQANVADAKSVVLVDYRGILVDQDTQLRKKLREEGVMYKVYKNKLMRRAFEGTELEALFDDLEGPSAIAISKTDATAGARIIKAMIKEAKKDIVTFKSGVIEGTYYDAKGISDIADVPSREVLLSRLLGSMQSPIANFARVLNQVAEKGDAAVEPAPAEAATEEATTEAATEEPTTEA